MMKDSDLYGQSLYDLASSENLADDILCQMQTVRQLFTENPDYVRLLTEPSIPKKQRLALLDEAFGSDMQPYLLNFLKILVENGMVRDFGGCCRRYTALYNADRGIAQAEVTSAVPLSGQQLERLRAKLEEISGKNSEGKAGRSSKESQRNSNVTGTAAFFAAGIAPAAGRDKKVV